MNIKVFMRYIKYKKYLSILIILIWFVTLTQVYAQENFVDTVKKSLDYIQIDKDTISNKLYQINNDKQVYFFWSYSFFTISKESDIIQVKKQLNREKILALLKDDKVLIVSNYIDPHTQCTIISEETAKLLDYYPEKIHTPLTTIYLVGGETENIQCYKYNNTLYLPNDELSKIDLEYIVKNSNSIATKTDNISTKNLQEIYHYVTNNTSYDYSALQYDSSIFTPYLASSFFQGKKVVCDGYSKVFSFLANASLKNWTVQRITGSRQNLDKKDEKSFLHSWVKIGDKYYDPTFDDNDDTQEKNNYYAKSQTCFNLDHYTSWRKMFTSNFERIAYSKQNSQHLIDTCAQNLAQILGKDDAIREFIQYILQNTDIETTKKFMCKAYQICALSAKDKESLATELSQYSIQFGTKTINLNRLLAISDTVVLDDETKIFLDEVIKKIKIKMFFYTPEQKEKFIKDIKMKIMIIILNENIPENIKEAMRYISAKI